MKKLSLVWKKYINRVSVLITVFSVLMTASFYNPASLAADSHLVSSDYHIRVSGRDIWNGDESKIYSRTFSFTPSSSLISSTSTSDATYRFSVPFQLTRSGGWSHSKTAYFDGAVAIKFNFSLSGGSNQTLAYGAFDSAVFYDMDGNLIPYGFLKDGNSIIIMLYCNGSQVYDTYAALLTGVLYFTASSHSWSIDSTPTFNPVLNLTASASPHSYTTCIVHDGISPSSISAVTNGYDASAGNASQSKLDTSMSAQEAKEDSLFTSASDNLSKFSLTDLSAMPKVVAGLAFVSSTMTSIFEALGGVNGAGIVLSVGCSILFVSFCIGAYKFYSGRKD